MPSRVSASRGLPNWRWPLFFLIIFAVVFFVGASTVRETYRGWKVDQEIEGLKNQVAQLEAQKEQMSSLLATMQTEEYIEQEARLRFNLKQPGERVVLFDEGDAAAPLEWSDRVTESEAANPDTSSNLKRWLEYFIAHPSTST